MNAEVIRIFILRHLAIPQASSIEYTRTLPQALKTQSLISNLSIIYGTRPTDPSLVRPGGAESITSRRTNCPGISLTARVSRNVA